MKNVTGYHTGGPLRPTTVAAEERYASYLDLLTYASIPCILLGLQVIILNSFVISHYKKKRGKFVPMMYLMISSVDIVTAVGVIYQSIAVTLLQKHLMSLNTFRWHYLICYTISAVSYRTSVFYNVVLAVARTIGILKPFYRIRKRLVIAAAIIYPMIWTGVVSYDIHEAFFENVAYYDYMDILAYPMTGINLFFAAWGLELYYGIFVAFVAIPFIIPVLIVLMTCVIQIVSLCRSKSDVGAAKNQRRVTITILLISILFVICNSGFSVYMLLLLFGDVIYSISMAQLYLIGGFAGTFLPILNAAFNPVIIISRSSGLRKDFMVILQKLKRAEEHASWHQSGVSTAYTSNTLYLQTAINAEKANIETILNAETSLNAEPETKFNAENAHSETNIKAESTLNGENSVNPENTLIAENISNVQNSLKSGNAINASIHLNLSDEDDCSGSIYTEKSYEDDCSGSIYTEKSYEDDCAGSIYTEKGYEVDCAGSIYTEKGYEDDYAGSIYTEKSYEDDCAESVKTEYTERSYEVTQLSTQLATQLSTLNPKLKTFLNPRP